MPRKVTKKCYCDRCSNETNHLVLANHRHISDTPVIYSSGEEDTFETTDDFLLLKCAGCDRVVLQHDSFSDMFDRVITRRYPPVEFRQLKSWVYEFEAFDAYKGAEAYFIPRLMREIYGALHAGFFAIAAMGIRALLENVMINKVGDQGTFKNNLNELQKKGFISSQEQSLLEATLELGHASIHRDYVPDKDDLVTALDITEHVIEKIYILPKKADALKKRIPPRK